jgi:UDP-N-acetylmuramoyl-tripeptide--D-alanyl-D-alanine ligase
MSTPIPTNRARFSAAEISLAVGGALVRGVPEIACEGVTTDTRVVHEGNVFFALKGASFDGHDYVETAIEKGAKCVVVSRIEGLESIAQQHPEVAFVNVEDTLIALGALAKFHRWRWKGLVVALTGSVGKSTTKELCRAMLRCALHPSVIHCTEGNLNNQIGVPMTLFGLQTQHRVAIIEMGTSARGEIATLADIAQPDIGLLVSIGTAHAEGLANAPAKPNEPWWVGKVSAKEAVCREKRTVLTRAHAVAIAGHDDPWSHACLAGADGPATLSFGFSEGASYRITRTDFVSKGTRVCIQRGEAGAVEFVVCLYGDALMNDVAGALAACDSVLALLREAPLSSEQLRSFSSQFERMPHRFEIHESTDGPWIIDDTYNASPEAFALSVRTAAQIAKAQNRSLVVVAGEMRELGDHAIEAHKALGVLVAEAGARLVIGCGGQASHTLELASLRGVRIHAGESSSDVATQIESLVEANDLVLIKGSRGARTELVAQALLHATVGGNEHAV